MENKHIILLIAVILVVGLLAVSLTGLVSKRPGPGGVGRCRDRDYDSYYGQSGCGTLEDCNDRDASINPGAVEICQDGIDQNCNGIDEACTTVSTSVTTVPACTDTDNGQNIFIKGTTTDSQYSYTDTCQLYNASIPPSVFEGYCDGGSLATVTLTCPNGYLCSDGACRLATGTTTGSTTIPFNSS